MNQEIFTRRKNKMKKIYIQINYVRSIAYIFQSYFQRISFFSLDYTCMNISVV